MNVTSKELAVLNALRTNEFGDGEEGAWVWANCINCASKPSGLEGKALSAVVGSLYEKGLAEPDGNTGRDACIRLTEEGIKACAA
jgi:hypothetical protein